jgi:hypothetical protein
MTGTQKTLDTNKTSTPTCMQPSACRNGSQAPLPASVPPLPAASAQHQPAYDSVEQSLTAVPVLPSGLRKQPLADTSTRHTGTTIPASTNTCLHAAATMSDCLAGTAAPLSATAACCLSTAPACFKLGAAQPDSRPSAAFRLATLQ